MPKLFLIEFVINGKESRFIKPVVAKSMEVVKDSFRISYMNAEGNIEYIPAPDPTGTYVRYNDTTIAYVREIEFYETATHL